MIYLVAKQDDNKLVLIELKQEEFFDIVLSEFLIPQVDQMLFEPNFPKSNIPFSLQPRNQSYFFRI
jgi:hypothetical protein